jgi:hypothetical protein
MSKKKKSRQVKITARIRHREVLPNPLPSVSDYLTNNS